MSTNPMKFDPDHTELLRALRAFPGVRDAAIESTGGGCQALEMRLTDGRIVCCTNGDADVPEQPWDRWGYAALFADDLAASEGRDIATRETTTEDGPIPAGTTPRGWTDAELVEIVRELVGAKKPRRTAKRSAGRELNAQEQWVVALVRQYGHPYSDRDVSAVEASFAEFFTAHDPTFNARLFHDACEAAETAACDAWDARRKQGE